MYLFMYTYMYIKVSEGRREYTAAPNFICTQYPHNKIIKSHKNNCTYKQAYTSIHTSICYEERNKSNTKPLKICEMSSFEETMRSWKIERKGKHLNI